MSKLETVKALSDSGPQLQIVESVKALQQTVTFLQEELKRLPEAISAETVKALEPLAQLRQEVILVLDAFDQVTTFQRKTLRDLTQQMSESATQAFEQRAEKMEEKIAELKISLSALNLSLNGMEQTTKQVATLPGKLMIAQQSMSGAANQLTEAAKQTRPRLWKQALGLILAGAVGAMVVAIGQVALDRLVPPSAVMQELEFYRGVLEKATPEELELIQLIGNQPAR